MLNDHPDHPAITQEIIHREGDRITIIINPTIILVALRLPVVHQARLWYFTDLLAFTYGCSAFGHSHRTDT